MEAWAARTGKRRVIEGAAWMQGPRSSERGMGRRKGKREGREGGESSDCRTAGGEAKAGRKREWLQRAIVETDGDLTRRRSARKWLVLPRQGKRQGLAAFSTIPANGGARQQHDFALVNPFSNELPAWLGCLGSLASSKIADRRQTGPAGRHVSGAHWTAPKTHCASR